MLEQSGATFEHIAPGGFEVAGVPRVGHVAGARGVVEEQMDFAFGVAAAHAGHVAEVPCIHADEQVEAVVVGTAELSGCVALTGDAVLGELATGWGIDGVAKFFGRCGSGLDVELLLTSGLADEVLHHVLGHGTAADVAVADK